MLSSSHPAPIENSRGFSKPPEAKEEPMLSFRGTQTFLVTGWVHPLSRNSRLRSEPCCWILGSRSQSGCPRGESWVVSRVQCQPLTHSQRRAPYWSIPKLFKNIKSTVTLDIRNLWEWANAPKMPASLNCEIVRLYEEFVYMKFSHMTELFISKQVVHLAAGKSGLDDL